MNGQFHEVTNQASGGPPLSPWEQRMVVKVTVVTLVTVVTVVLTILAKYEGILEP